MRKPEDFAVQEGASSASAQWCKILKRPNDILKCEGSRTTLSAFCEKGKLFNEVHVLIIYVDRRRCSSGCHENIPKGIGKSLPA